MIFRTCPDCGCTLDPGEHCDCRDETAARQEQTHSCEDERSEPEQ